VDPLIASEAWKRHAAHALEGLSWREESVLAIVVELPAVRADGGTDTYFVRFDFAYYPEWPPRVTFIDGDGKYSPKAWPEVSGKSEIAFHADYGDAPQGMVCNSMFFEYYFWGGHNPEERIAWNPARHTFAATINELRDALRHPYYRGRRT